MSDFAIQQTNLAYGRIRNRRAVVVIPSTFGAIQDGLRERAKATGQSELIFRAARIAALMEAQKSGSAWRALDAGYRVLGPRP